jgi:hypothetical protein
LDLPDEINCCDGYDGQTMAVSREYLSYEGRNPFVSFLETLAERDTRGDAKWWLLGEA